MRNWFAALILAAPGVAGAHPHVFVETGFEVIFNDAGLIEAVRVNWRYDELTSLYVAEERGVDPDFDGEATPEELAALQGFDMTWPEAFEGDTYLTVDGVRVALGAPEEVSAGYAEGKVSSSHLRRLAEPVDPRKVVVLSPYDPSYYSAYEIVSETALTGREGCRAELWVPDYDAAAEQLQVALEELMGDAQAQGFDEAEFPPVGDMFAQEVRVACDAGS
ncbi:DUF1007 family protein [Vannielia litorea]|uniref:ABC-type uncharacterized transport system, substrate-binding protein n=1 Tax=Vannielia litorea TaxID=1217970 RepID=A0A1N6EDG2_9RHOB|nr:DUF1007 family protein [Vannielia litorea]SIN81078.1 ABC-type uncharacterized transport system, substrate-binding protein [Vannielia litorea]